MNRTKRKIFETSMDLFAKKGYDSTSIEEITSVVGIAKGTLYYHFSSKEEILDFLMVEGLKLLEHSLDTKTRQVDNIKDKIYSIILVEMKVVAKYENLIGLVINEICGDKKRNEKCRECVGECVNVIERVLNEAYGKNEIKKCNTTAIAYEIFGVICSGVLLRYKNKDEFEISKSAREFTNSILDGIIND